ncbi:MAG: DNA mismatch repair endonuclease MutL [Acidobacteria bacterium]|nr:DNA mismatch repair endonuclease MutL [Acidobacteriota bacterium]MCW5948772.1 DNA mismatch repair endonuclease MutL [Pyrinomonadaceae bacterium]
MQRIRILPDNLANQIAAGEVVERPASVVKELVENAIDAGARRIAVDIELGGRRLIRVADDGHGMTRDDAILAFERHATSKITSLDDLGRIGTLGFRGEALASIASVAKVELITKIDPDETATKVNIDGGRLADVRDAGRDNGTTIAVRDLFFNTPARRKFMRSEATENYHLTSIITHYALANPDIAFNLNNNGREVIRAAPARDLRERAFQLFGGDLLESLLPVKGGRQFVAEVSGFVSAPRERRTNRDSQFFFVNRRFVRDKVIAEGLRDAYRSVLPHGIYPVAFLFLEMPVEEVDVNVHPAKTEVRFRRSDAVRDVISEAVRTSLVSAGVSSAADRLWQPAASSVPAGSDPGPSLSLVPDAVSIAPPPKPSDAAVVEAQQSLIESLSEPLTDLDDEAAGDIAISIGQFELEIEEPETVAAEPETDDAGVQNNEASQWPVAAELPPVDSAAKLVKEAAVEDLSRSSIRPLAQLHDSFIIAVDDEGLLLIDQHVAHERILFDKFRRRETDRPVESQNLLLPETIDLTPAQSEAFALIENDLEELGFGVMKLSGRTVAIKSIPTDVPAAEVRNLLAEMLDTVERGKRGGAKTSIRDDIAASLACKAAIKINMKLTPEKMRWLIDRLLVTSSPTTCPHGRPVVLRLTMRDIERGFHRT